MSKINDLEIPFVLKRNQGEATVIIRIEADNREICEKILNSIEISGDVSNYSLLKMDKYPKETNVVIVVDTKNIL